MVLYIGVVHSQFQSRSRVWRESSGSKGLTLLARIDRSANQARVGIGDESDRPAHLGSSKADTLLMVASTTAAMIFHSKHSPGAMRMGTYGSATTARNTWQSGMPFHLIVYGTSLESELCVKSCHTVTATIDQSEKEIADRNGQ